MNKTNIIKTTYPQLSIIIACYNSDSYLPCCLDSIAKQTFKDYEVVIVDDGSTDTSKLIAYSYTLKDKRFKLYTHPENKGTLLARKTGIENARGRYILFLDPDDYYKTATLLEKVMNYIQDTNVDIFHFGFSDFHTNNTKMRKLLKQYLHLSKRRILGSHAIIERCFVKREYSWHLCDKVFKAQIIKPHCQQIPNVYSIMGEDIFLYFLFAFYAHSYESRPLTNGYIYRIGSGITSREYQKEITFVRMVSGDSLSRKMIMNHLLTSNSYGSYQNIYSDFEQSMLELHLDRLSELQREAIPNSINLLFDHYDHVEVIRSLYRRKRSIKVEVQHLLFQLNNRTID